VAASTRCVSLFVRSVRPLAPHLPFLFSPPSVAYHSPLDKSPPHIRNYRFYPGLFSRPRKLSDIAAFGPSHRIRPFSLTVKRAPRALVSFLTNMSMSRRIFQAPFASRSIQCQSNNRALILGRKRPLALIHHPDQDIFFRSCQSSAVSMPLPTFVPEKSRFDGTITWSTVIMFVADSVFF